MERGKKANQYLFLLLLLLATVTAFSQQLPETQKNFTYYFNAQNKNHQAVFDLDSTNNVKFFKYFISLQIRLTALKDSVYHLEVFANNHMTDCPLKYRNFFIKDSLFVDTVFFTLQIKPTAEPTLVLQKQSVLTKVPQQFFDTLLHFSSKIESYIADFENIDFSFGAAATQRLKNKKAQIDAYYQTDSVFSDLRHQLDNIDIENVDRIPLYQFWLAEVKNKVKEIDQKRYETLLSNSKINNEDYLLTLSQFYQRIASLETLIDQKTATIDDLFYQKAETFEEQADTTNAIFYYNRTLEYNPQHCKAMEKVSHLYNQLYRSYDNKVLFEKIKARGDSLSCYNRLINIVYDSLYNRTNRFIGANNFYDALKIIDTIDLLCKVLPVESCFSYLPSLKERAQQGIYTSFYEIIFKAVRTNNLDLSISYCYGLNQLMLSHGNSINNQSNFGILVNIISEKIEKKARENIVYKQYNEAVKKLNTLAVFLDSLNQPTPPSLDFLYQEAHTSHYLSLIKKADSAEAKGEKTAAITLKQEAYTYLSLFEKYINLSTNQFIDTAISVDDFRFESLKSFLFQDETTKDLDSLLLFKQFLLTRNLMPEKDIKLNYLVEKQVKNSISRHNQFVWSSEFSQAKLLMKKIEQTIEAYGLNHKNPELMAIKGEAVALFDRKLSLHLEEEFRFVQIKSQSKIAEKNYLQAYNLLVEKERELQQKQFYNQEIAWFIRRIEPAAAYQDSLLFVNFLLSIENYVPAFELYEKMGDFFKKEQLQKFGLSHESLAQFIKPKAQKQKKLARSISCFFAQKHDCEQAITFYFVQKEQTPDFGFQERLAALLKDNTACIQEYQFDKSDRYFLQLLLGKTMSKKVIKKK